MQTLPILIAEMRMMGVKRLELELDAAPALEPEPTEARDTERPAEDKPEGACARPDCMQPREGLFGGAAGAQYCRAHALAEAGVKR
jgi:hypothetical protein